ncbi:amidase [Granulicella sibirica]|uniref:Amidotransferase n=1 Tax=Granulicella sibirica TaxID=2479048 RepID=A0A4Q0T5J3_9BACT|nr:amidase [Granulicella sibirica]RXH57309.1 amidotransferase [Granulicella sibirica]
MRSLQPIADTLERLANGKLSSSALVGACLKAIDDPAGEGSRTFIRVDSESARRTAAELDASRPKSPLAGLPISVKDLLDVVGEPTAAGSAILADAAPSERDAVAVQRLRHAGAVLVGRTNMTEFAFSGLGLNPHYGTPRNPYDRVVGRIPGGSSSGAAISVTDQMASAAIGSDTGGSVRIPAALCGLTGFKPTARRVSLEGSLPLSSTMDSLGPLAPTVACCALIDAVLAGDDPKALEVYPLAGLRLAVLQGYVLDGLEALVSSAFASALSLLSSFGAMLTDVTFASLEQIPMANQKGGFSAAESYAWHRPLLAENAARYDPRVLSRILRGKEMSAADYIDVLNARKRIMADAAAAFEGFDAILMPTVPRIAPPIADLEASDAAYFDANVAMLRNPSIINFLDGCALSIPSHMPGEGPVGLTIAGLSGQDRKILGIGAAIEAVLATGGRAIHGQASWDARA